jgi:hypothetical protein
MRRESKSDGAVGREDKNPYLFIMLLLLVFSENSPKIPAGFFLKIKKWAGYFLGAFLK